jgi:hypothetical protein
MIARAAPARIGLAVIAVALLSACGDDLESRQAAVQEQQPTGGEITVGEPQPQVSRATRTPAAEATAQGFDDEGRDDDDVAFDAMPEPLVDNAQGFDPDPIDDTSGFDPTPTDPSGFAPEPIGPESFEE